MKTNRVITSITLSLTIFFAIYLIGSFINAKFSIKEWTEESRSMSGGFGGIISLVIGRAYLWHPEK